VISDIYYRGTKCRKKNRRERKRIDRGQFTNRLANARNLRPKYKIALTFRGEITNGRLIAHRSRRVIGYSCGRNSRRNDRGVSPDVIFRRRVYDDTRSSEKSVADNWKTWEFDVGVYRVFASYTEYRIVLNAHFVRRVSERKYRF